MKPFITSIKLALFVLIIFRCTNQTCAEDSNTIPPMKVLWQKEITADANMDCSLGPVVFDKTNKKLLIAGTSFRPRVYSEGKLWLLEVDTNNSNINRTIHISDINESRAAAPITLAVSLISGLMVSENNDVTLVGKFDNTTSPISIVKVTRSINASKLIKLASKNNSINDFPHINGGISLPGDNLLLMGGGKDGGSVTMVGSKGDRLWNKRYKIGQGRIEFFNNGLAVGDKNEIAIVGCSANVKGKFPDVAGEDFILLCSVQGDVIAKDIFSGSPDPGELPEVCQLSSGNFVVVFCKSKSTAMPKSDVNIRTYSPDLKLLWEKSVVKSAENKPSSFKIAAVPKNGFVVAADVDFGNLRVYEYDEKGNMVATFSRDKEVWSVNIGLVCMDKKAFVVFQTRPDMGQSNKISKIKIVALELK